MAKDLLKSVAARGKTTTGKTAKQEKVWGVDQDVEESILEVAGLLTIKADLKGPSEQREGDLKLKLFDRWVGEMWEGRNQKLVPENPRVIIKKRDETGKLTEQEDAKLLFQVKAKKDGIAKRVPDLTERAEDKSAYDYIKEILVSEEVGLTPENAASFVDPEDGEVSVKQRVGLIGTLDQMLESKDKHVVSFAQKMLKSMNAMIGKAVKVEPYTDEEMAAVVRSYEEITIKDEFFSRAATYCEDATQLNKLLLVSGVTLGLSSVEYGIADTKVEKIERMNDLLIKFLDIEDSNE